MTVTNHSPSRRYYGWFFDLGFALVLIAAAYFRFTGLDWGDYQYLHPDERFLVWVGTDITPLKCDDPAIPIDACPKEMQSWMGIGEYFDAARSTLNPNNRGHGFYVYGTLPMFTARFLVQWIFGHSGFNEMTDVGRALSALVDLGTVILVYLIGTRLYDKRVGLMASAFSAVTVMQIQQAHYFTMDAFMTMFTYLAIYFAVWVAKGNWERINGAEMVGPGVPTANPDEPPAPVSPLSRLQPHLNRFVRHPYFALSLAFGFALGSAVASKLNAAPVAILLPTAFALSLLASRQDQSHNRVALAFSYLVLAALTSIVVFRLFQPYAFSGPGLFGLSPNPEWVADIREQRIQAGGDVDFPPALQWARRPVWFSGQNLVLWGLGLPLGVLAWAGFLWAGWRLLADRSEEKSQWHRHALLWGWTGFYFVWQSLAFNPTMRYQLPIYPALAVFAGWAVIELWDQGRLTSANGQANRLIRGWTSALAVAIGFVILAATAGWAIAFTGIYQHPTTRVEASHWIYQHVPGPLNIVIQADGGEHSQPVAIAYGTTITTGLPYTTYFTPQETGLLSRITGARAVDASGDVGVKTAVFTVTRVGDPMESVSARYSSVFPGGVDGRGEPLQVMLNTPLPVEKDVQYQITIGLEGAGGTLSLSGAATANESSWDDGLPLRVDGYDGYGGIYQPGLNFELYWDDNPEKLTRLQMTLDQADYIFISSNRQWGSIPRMPERYPLTSVYYRSLLGCPPEKAIDWCYSVAQVGSFQGDLGFDLAAVFDGSPRLGPIRLNTQFAEEAFTVYDHPKVMIFRKNSAYDSERVSSILSAVDLSQAVHVTPKRAGGFPANLMLPPERWEEQKVGGTWAELFDSQGLVNRYPLLGALVWYAALSLLGWALFPVVYTALPGLADRGFPLARTTGMLLLSYFTWLAGSARVPVTRPYILAILGALLLSSAWLAYRQRGKLGQTWKSHWRYILVIEGLFLAFFVLNLLIRMGNPDLWHPWKGGEKPMDFAYFNAVLKSTSFPPYDPWFAGGYLNYYYFGFVFTGMLVKLLGIEPAIAYNLVIPTMFAMIGLGAFSLAWNLVSRAWHYDHSTGEGKTRWFWSAEKGAGGIRYGAGIAAALGMAVLGNLGSLRMILQGYQRLAAPGGAIEGAGLLQRIPWTLAGFFQTLAGADLPYSLGDWYWIPSRAIPAPNDVEPITEFPFFTVLYADPHAHLFALPLTLLALAWVISIVLHRARSTWQLIGSFFLGALAIGALRPTNTWNFYPFLALGLLAVAFSAGVNGVKVERRIPFYSDLPDASQRLIAAAVGVGALLILAYGLYLPYGQWYGLGYSKIDLWRGTHTPLSAYLTHWGLFLFVIISWMVAETLDWMSKTPVSALGRLRPIKELLIFMLLCLLALIIILTLTGAQVAWFVLFLAAWAAVLILRPGQPDERRLVLFLIGTGLTLTLMVEVIVLVGDIGRMNTVFKFYLQVWTLFAISAAASLGWLLPQLRDWRPRLRLAWQIVLVGLVFSAALFPLLGGAAKIKDRIALNAPLTLDGMAYMAYAEYGERWGMMDLSEDYRAILWMQENVAGSPVIVEANLRDLYRWGSRFSIYTGLPGVVGWEWHQQQQRALLPGSRVSDRIAQIENFYETTDLAAAREFLARYGVRYIVLGQQERGLYPGVGLDKFLAAEGVLWQRVYVDGQTEIYEVLKQ